MQTNIYGFSIGNLKYNSFAYSYDVTVFCSKAIGLQKFINISYFTFAINKTECINVGKNIFRCSSKVTNYDHLEIFGTMFIKDDKCYNHIKKRVSKCRETGFSQIKCGLVYPDGTTDVTSYLLKSVCVPLFMYVMAPISKSNIKKLDTTWSNVFKLAAIG